MACPPGLQSNPRMFFALSERRILSWASLDRQSGTDWVLGSGWSWLDYGDGLGLKAVDPKVDDGSPKSAKISPRTLYRVCFGNTYG